MARDPKYRVVGFDGYWRDIDLLPGSSSHKISVRARTKSEALKIAKDWMRKNPPVPESRRKWKHEPFVFIENVHSASSYPDARWSADEESWKEELNRLKPQKRKKNPQRYAAAISVVGRRKNPCACTCYLNRKGELIDVRDGVPENTKNVAVVKAPDKKVERILKNPSSAEVEKVVRSISTFSPIGAAIGGAVGAIGGPLSSAALAAIGSFIGVTYGENRVSNPAGHSESELVKRLKY